MMKRRKKLLKLFTFSTKLRHLITLLKKSAREANLLRVQVDVLTAICMNYIATRFIEQTYSGHFYNAYTGNTYK